MYVGQVQLRVRVTDGGEIGRVKLGQTTSERTATIYVDGDVSTDATDGLNRVMFDAVGQPWAYATDLTFSMVEQGGSSAAMEVVLSLLEPLKEGAWETLLTLVTAEVMRQINSNRKPPDEQ